MNHPLLATTMLLCLGHALHGEESRKVYLHGNTALHSAAYREDSAGVVRLMAGADVNVRNDSGRTPLFNAAANARLETMEVLLDRGALVNAKDTMGRTPMFEAARNGHFRAVELLVAHGAEIPKHGPSLINEAVASGHYPDGHCEQRREKLVRYFLEKGVEVNAKGSGPSSYGGSECSPLVTAAARAGRGVLALLLEHGAELEVTTSHGATPLIIAAGFGNNEATKFLLEKGVKLETKDWFGRTALHAAVRQNNVAYGNPEVVKTLLKAGADVNAQDRKGRTPLHEAVAWGWPDHPEMVTILLDAGASQDAKDKGGGTPRSSAADKPEMAKLIESWEQEQERKARASDGGSAE